MKLLLHGLNYAPEEIGIGKYSGEMVAALAEAGHDVTVVTTPPYYPAWEIGAGYSAWRYQREAGHSQGKPGSIEVIRCPLYVPAKVTGLKRVVHLASFAISSIPAVLIKALTFRPDVLMTVEPAAMCMPTTWIAARLCGAKAWLHVQDFEVDAAFELGILRSPLTRRIVLAVEAFLMRRFDRVSSISPNMLLKLAGKGVDEDRLVAFPNWVDCDWMRPLESDPAKKGTRDPRSLEQIRKRFQIASDKCICMYAGNIGAKQGLDLVVEAASLLSSRTDIHFVICGRGAAYDNIHAMSEGMSNVQWIEIQPLERFNELLNCADIHLLPQKADAADLVMPSKLTGMLATGRPVIACASAGTQIADVVEGHGLIVPPGNANELAAAVITLASDPSLRQRLGKSARQYAVDHLGRMSILQKFMADLEATVRRPSEAVEEWAGP